MKLTLDKLNTHFEVENAIYEIASKVINELAIDRPEVLHYGRRSILENIDNDKDYIVIYYGDAYSDCDDIDSVRIPNHWFIDGVNTIKKYIINQWENSHIPIPEPEKNDDPKTIWEYIKTLYQYSNKWRKAIDKATEYSDNGLDPNDYIKEIKEYAEKF